jgi:hypothetical protein
MQGRLAARSVCRAQSVPECWQKATLQRCKSYRQTTSAILKHVLNEVRAVLPGSCAMTMHGDVMENQGEEGRANRVKCTCALMKANAQGQQL